MKNIDVNGMSIDDILSLSQRDISGLSRSDLAKVTSRLASAANKRIKRAQASPFGQDIINKAGGSFSVAGKNQGQLQGEFARAKAFLSLKQSSKQGALKVLRRAEKLITKNPTKSSALRDNKKLAEVKTMTEDMWKIFHKAQELNANIGGSQGSPDGNTIDLIRTIYNNDIRYGDDLDAIAMALVQALKGEYEKEEEQRAAQEEAVTGGTALRGVGPDPRR